MPTHCEACGNFYEPIETLHLQCPTCMLLASFPEVAETAVRSAASRTRNGFAPPSVADLAPHFGDLEILELAGRGGMSAVYKARQKSLDRFVALKILPIEVAEAGGSERFHREAKALAQLTHPNIVSIHSFGEAGPWAFFVMEYVEGCNLRQIVGEGDLCSDEILRIVLDTCEALQYAHDRGVVHRDIKPENILLDRQQGVKLVDFGLAKVLASRESLQITGTGQVVGTPSYLAPEQLRRPKQVDRRADLYALGVMIYELLTGDLPMGSFTPPSVKSKRNQKWDAICQRALAAEPDRRYSQARDLAKDLSSVAVASTSKGGGEKLEPLVRDGWAWAAACASLILLGSSVYFADRGIEQLRVNIGDTAHLKWGLHEFLRGGVCVLFAVVIAWSSLDANLKPENRSLPQRLIALVVTLGHAMIAIALTLLPACLVVLFAAIPVFSPESNRHWTLIDIHYRESDSQSFYTPYWYQAIGVAAAASSVWTLALFGGARFWPKLERRFEPLREQNIQIISWAILIVGVIVLLPLAGMFLLAADSFR